jgi:hypothetical protein
MKIHEASLPPYALITDGMSGRCPWRGSSSITSTEMHMFTWGKEVASVSIFYSTLARLRKPQQRARALGPSFIDGVHWFAIQIVSMHPQNLQNSAGFAEIAAYDLLQIGNSATPPVLN